MLAGYLPVPVRLHLWKRVGATTQTEWVTIPAIKVDGGDAALISYINSIIDGSIHFSELEAGFVGRYFTLTGHGYDFSILSDSENIDLLGLAPAISSRIYYPMASLVADFPMPLTGRLIADVILDIVMDDMLGGTIEDSVTITAASTLDNATLADLINDINTALDATDFEPINAAIRDGSLVLSTLGPEFQILDTSERVNLLGLRGDWETVEYRELSEFTASGAVPTTGQLVRDVILVIRIEETDLLDSLGRPYADVLLGAVTITAASTSDNTGVADLISDINIAFSTTAIPRYEGPGPGLPIYFGDYITAENRDGRLALIGNHEFKVKRASRNISLLGMTAGDDLLPEYVFFNSYINADADMPSAVLAGAVTLDIGIIRSGEYFTGSVTIPVDGTNATLNDLVSDVNAEMVLAGFGDITAGLNGNSLFLSSLFAFTIFGTSASPALLGLTAVSPGSDAPSGTE